MGWGLGYDDKWKRHIGYGVPAYCDHPSCNEKIDRGLSYVCGSEPYGGEFGCGLYFCANHLYFRKPRGCEHHITLCARCIKYGRPYTPKPDHPEWVEHVLADKSWKEWRELNPEYEKLHLTKEATDGK